MSITTEERNRRFWAYMDMYDVGYTKLVKKLSQEFGAVFYVETTGGGCMAIMATLEGYGLMITDAEDTLSSMQQRKKARKQGRPHGYAVGVYPIEVCDGKHWDSTTRSFIDGGPCGRPEHGGFGPEAVGWASCPQADTAPQLIQLIKLAIRSVGTFGADGPGFVTHIDPALLTESSR